MANEQIDLNDPSLVDALVEHAADESTDPPCRFITGIAGSGKTYSVKLDIDEDASKGMLCATTGIAAVNLGSITLHSALGLTPDTIEDDYQTGRLSRRLHDIGRRHRNLIIDECSMLGGKELLDIIYLATKGANQYTDMKDRPMGITLVGDFCQLPPINASWCFEADYWPNFESNMTKLTKNWRQGDGKFLDTLNLLRGGDGSSAARMLPSAGVEFARNADPNFDGTTIVGTNDEVDRYNNIHFVKLAGPRIEYVAYRTGKQRSEWLKNIPDKLSMKTNALVMVLSNDTAKDPLTKEPLFRWVNGDLGHIVEADAASVVVKLIRTGKDETIGYVERENTSRTTPSFWTNVYNDDDIETAKRSGVPLSDGSYWDREKRVWVLGRIRYMPLRLAWATTVHKSQGLTLDRCQIDLRHAFVGKPAMAYVSASRCRTAQGLRFIGTPELLARRCSIDDKVKRWL